jgi:TatD DNase family protein
VQNLRDVAAIVPERNLLIETDAPFLAPVPNRGQRNEPAWVASVATQLAVVRGKSQEEIARLTTDNFYRFFQLKDSDTNVGWLL